ncbi:hypothetical protein [Thiolapillus sp.]
MPAPTRSPGVLCQAIMHLPVARHSAHRSNTPSIRIGDRYCKQSNAELSLLIQSLRNSNNSLIQISPPATRTALEKTIHLDPQYSRESERHGFCSRMNGYLSSMQIGDKLFLLLAEPIWCINGKHALN